MRTPSLYKELMLYVMVEIDIMIIYGKILLKEKIKILVRKNIFGFETMNNTKSVLY